MKLDLRLLEDCFLINYNKKFYILFLAPNPFLVKVIKLTIKLKELDHT